MIYRLNLFMLFLLVLSTTSRATVHEKIITDCNHISNVCVGDTIRFIGDSLNSNAYGVTFVSVFNSISQNYSYYNIISNTGTASTQDHVLINGDETFELQMCGNIPLFFIYNCPLDISEISKDHYQTQIYPNPTTGNFTITHNQNINNYLLEIVDVMGNTVHREILINGNQQKIETKQLSSGIYFIKILNQQQVNSYAKISVVR